ncbi:TIGR02757 family protein [Carboxylicivirga linearis]|nr:TIGR02757 family protein [Carboxylicivirga linearis]
MNQNDIKEFLDEKVLKYNQPNFIPNDPIQIPHLFTKKEDIEIAGFLSAILAWGKRDQIIKSAKKLMQLLDHSPYDFITHASDSDLNTFETFYYRTFSSIDCIYFIKALKHIYNQEGGLENVFTKGYNEGGLKEALRYFRSVFLSYNSPDRTHKHIANIDKGASAKRINMFLRWMVRDDDKGVDFGIWKNISTKDLLLPLDVHTGNVSRKLGFLTRKQNDMKALDEIMYHLRNFDAVDPVKYDFALFGLGIEEQF